jgi:hypothetical protein
MVISPQLCSAAGKMCSQVFAGQVEHIGIDVEIHAEEALGVRAQLQVAGKIEEVTFALGARAKRGL